MLNKLRKSDKFSDINSSIYHLILKKNIDVEDKIDLLKHLNTMTKISQYGDELIKAMFIYPMNNYDFNLLFKFLLDNGATIPEDIYNVFPVKNCQLLDAIHSVQPIEKLPDLFIARLCRHNIDGIGLVYDRYLLKTPINEIFHPSLFHDLYYHLLSDNEMCYLLSNLSIYGYEFENVKSNYFFPHLQYALNCGFTRTFNYLIEHVHKDFSFMNNVFMIFPSGRNNYIVKPIMYDIIDLSSTLPGAKDMAYDIAQTGEEVEEELRPVKAKKTGTEQYSYCYTQNNISRNRYRLDTTNNKIALLINDKYNEIMGVLDSDDGTTIYEEFTKNPIGMKVGDIIFLNAVYDVNKKTNELFKQFLTMEKIQELDKKSSTKFTEVAINSTPQIYKYCIDSGKIQIEDLLFNGPKTKLDSYPISTVLEYVITYLQSNPKKLEQFKGHIFDTLDFESTTQDIIIGGLATCGMCNEDMTEYLVNLETLFGMIEPCFTETYIYNLFIIIRTAQNNISTLPGNNKYSDVANKIIDMVISRKIILTNTKPVLCIAGSLVRYSLSSYSSIKVDIPIDLLTKLIDLGFSKELMSNGHNYLKTLGDNYKHLIETPVENVYINNKCSICLESVDKLCYSDRCGHAVICLNCYAKSDKSKCVMCKESFGNLKFIKLMY